MTHPFQGALRAALETVVVFVATQTRKRLSATANPFLVGIHAPIGSEKTLDDLAVSGTIPSALNGRYLKMGANPVNPDPHGHWFLGDGMVHGIALTDGQAQWYRNRWIGSRVASKALGRPSAPGPRRTRNDTVNTNVVDFGGRAFALVEAGSFPVELSETLEAQRYNPFDGTLETSFTGHPHRDPLTGEFHAVAYDGSNWNAVRHIVVNASGKVVRNLALPVEHGPCIHDCAITNRFVIVLDLPVTFSMRAVLAGASFPFRWNGAHRARVGLLPRSGDVSEIIWCEIEACFVFHVANAFDREDGCVILDVVAYDTMFASDASGLDALGRFERWTIDIAAKRVERQVVDPTPQEFPRIDERRIGRDYRYTYTVSVPADGNPQLEGATTIFKHDLETGKHQTHDFGADCSPGEFIFIPASVDSGEDDGWLIGFVVDRPADVTDLVILDARNFEAPAVASVRIPHRIPPGFHGNWFPRA